MTDVDPNNPPAPVLVVSAEQAGRWDDKPLVDQPNRTRVEAEPASAG